MESHSLYNLVDEEQTTYSRGGTLDEVRKRSERGLSDKTE